MVPGTGSEGPGRVKPGKWRRRQIKCALLSWSRLWAAGALPCWCPPSGWIEQSTHRITGRNTYPLALGSYLDLLWLRVAHGELTHSHSWGHRVPNPEHREPRAGGRTDVRCRWHKMVTSYALSSTIGSRIKKIKRSAQGESDRAQSLLTGCKQGDVSRFGPICYKQCFNKEVSIRRSWFIFSYFCKPSHFPRHSTTKN